MLFYPSAVFIRTTGLIPFGYDPVGAQRWWLMMFRNLPPFVDEQASNHSTADKRSVGGNIADPEYRYRPRAFHWISIGSVYVDITEHDL